MASTTKAQLATELAQARARIAQLENQLEAERAQHQRMDSIAQARNKPPMPQWQIDRANAMAAAKAMAMVSNRIVKA